MQISKCNIEKRNLDIDRLLTDELYGLRIACEILSYNRNAYSDKFSFWLGFYRSGNAYWKEKIRNNAVAYDRLIRKTAATIGYMAPTSRTLAVKETNKYGESNR